MVLKIEYSRKVNKNKSKELYKTAFNSLPPENLNEYSLRANYKMLTLKC